MYPGLVVVVWIVVLVVLHVSVSARSLVYHNVSESMRCYVRALHSYVHSYVSASTFVAPAATYLLSRKGCGRADGILLPDPALPRSKRDVGDAVYVGHAMPKCRCSSDEAF